MEPVVVVVETLCFVNKKPSAVAEKSRHA